MQAEVRWMAPGERDAALACYLRNEYRGGIAPEDRALVAVAGGDVVGVVRLAREHGLRILRGMFLDVPWRRRGLGTRMLAHLAEGMADESCWLVCGPHLHAFYARAGFAPEDLETAPPHLVERARTYVSAHGPMGVMRRPPGP